jgi:hypothetical protein
MQINPQTPIVLNLNVEATNVILSALSAQPYDKVANLIAAIQQQAAPQIQPPEAPQEVPAPAAE